MSLLHAGETLNMPNWRMELWLTKENKYITDISRLVCTSMRISKERNKSDQLSFTIDLVQFQKRCEMLNADPAESLKPYIHKIKVFRENKFVTECIVEKVVVHLNNEEKPTIELTCIGWFGLLAKRLIHQDYSAGTWADFAAEAIMDAQHEPNRIYNYSFEGDAHKVTNSWFRGWDFRVPGLANWQPLTRYNPGDVVIYQGSKYYAKAKNDTMEEILVGNEITGSCVLRIKKDPITNIISKRWTVGAKVTDETKISFQRTYIKNETTRSVFLGWNTGSGTRKTRFLLSNPPSSGKIRATHTWALYFSDGSCLKRAEKDIYYYDANGNTTYAVKDGFVQNGTGTIWLPADISVVDMNGDVSADSQVMFMSENGYQWQVLFNDGSYIQRDGKRIFQVQGGTTRNFSNASGNVLITEFQMTNVGAAVTKIIGEPHKDPDITFTIDKSNDWRINFAQGSYIRRQGLAVTYYDYDPVGQTTVAIPLANSLGTVLEGRDEWPLPAFTTISSITGAPGLDGDVSIVTNDFITGTDFEGSYFQEKTELCWREEEGWSGLSSCHINEDNCEVSTTLVAPFEPALGRLYVRFYANKLAADSKLYLTLQRDNGQEFYRTGNLLDSTQHDVWQKIEILLPQQTDDIYRLAFLTETNGVVIDSVVAYKQPIEGDNWDLGIRLGKFPSVQEQSEWNHNRFSTNHVWKQADNLIYDLSMMDSDNFEYDIDEEHKFNIYSTKGKSVLEVDLSFPKNITQMTISSNAQDVINYLIADGADETFQDPEVSHIETVNSAPFMTLGYSEESQNKYWALATKERYDSERDIDSLKQDIASRIDIYNNVQDIPTVTLKNGVIDVENVSLGDLVSITALDYPYVTNVNGLYRILGWEVQVTGNGDETITLTLAIPTVKQINAMSFPKMIKLLQRRIMNSR